MNPYLSQCMKEIETILQSSQRPEADLFQYYTTKTPDCQPTYVIALIGALLTERKRRENAASQP